MNLSGPNRMVLGAYGMLVILALVVIVTAW